MYKIEKISMDGKEVLNTISNGDYEHNFRVGERCKITTHRGRVIRGTLSYIEEDCLECFTDVMGPASIPYDAIDEMQEINETPMKLSSFRYVLTDTGGGWGTIHNLYGVTPSGDVYTTKNFKEETMDVNTTLFCEYVGHLDKVELGLKPKKHFSVMDASYLVVIEVGDTFSVVYEGDNVNENNPSLYEDIQVLVRTSYDMEYNKAKKSASTNFAIGEVSSSEDFRNTMKALTSGGVPVCTTFHMQKSISKLKKMIDEELGLNEKEDR